MMPSAMISVYRLYFSENLEEVEKGINLLYYKNHPPSMILDSEILEADGFLRYILKE